MRSQALNPRACRIRQTPLPPTQTSNKPAPNLEIKKLKLYGLLSDPLEAYPTLRNQKSTPSWPHIRTLTRMPQFQKSKVKAIWRPIRPLTNTPQSQKFEIHTKCEVPSYEPKGLADPTSPPLASNQNSNFKTPILEFSKFQPLWPQIRPLTSTLHYLKTIN